MVPEGTLPRRSGSLEIRRDRPPKAMVPTFAQAQPTGHGRERERGGGENKYKNNRGRGGRFLQVGSTKSFAPGLFAMSWARLRLLTTSELQRPSFPTDPQDPQLRTPKPGSPALTLSTLFCQPGTFLAGMVFGRGRDPQGTIGFGIFPASKPKIRNLKPACVF